MMHGDRLDSVIQIKNETMPTLRACTLDYWNQLVHLDLSMNKIAVVDGVLECSNLRVLILADNMIREIGPRLLVKLPRL